MKYTAQDIEDILFDGAKEQMEALASSESDGPISYDSSKDSIRIVFGSELSALHGHDLKPNCIEFYGSSHKFK